MLSLIAQVLRCLAIVCCCALGFASILATGGGGGGGGTASITQPVITPLDPNNEYTATGTYQLTSFEFYFPNGQYFSSSELDSFNAQMTLDVPADWTTYEIEWHDAQFGNYYDYDAGPISQTNPNTSWDDAHYEITGPYTIAFYFDNLCADGVCADVIMRIQKISDLVFSLLAGSVVVSIGDESHEKADAFAEAHQGGAEDKLISASMRNIWF
jgi:hypothetical protein